MTQVVSYLNTQGYVILAVPHTDQGLNLCPLLWKCGVLTIGPSGKSFMGGGNLFPYQLFC